MDQEEITSLNEPDYVEYLAGLDEIEARIAVDHLEERTELACWECGVLCFIN